MYARFTPSLPIPSISTLESRWQGVYLAEVAYNIAVSSLQRTPLHLACYSGHAETANYLLNKGADPTVLDTFDNNCLHLAIRAQQRYNNITEFCTFVDF